MCGLIEGALLGAQNSHSLPASETAAVDVLAAIVDRAVSVAIGRGAGLPGQQCEGPVSPP